MGRNIWQRRQQGNRKYYNDKVEFQGQKFDSKAEWNYYMLLADRQRRGEIRDLQRQVPFTLQPTFKDSKGNTVRSIKYLADFVYYDTDTGKRHVVDVKGSEDVETDVFKIKRKMFAYVYKEEIEVVYVTRR